MLHTPPASSALKRRVSSLGGKPDTPDGSPIAGAAAIARAAGFGMDSIDVADSPRSPTTRPKRLSRVSFASSVDVKDRSSSPSPEKEEEEQPPSPSRGQRSNRSTYSFGLRASMDGEDAEAFGGLPSSPPESPGRVRQLWTCFQQRWEEVAVMEQEIAAKKQEMENQQREIEERDFELQEEKRQSRESRLFLARKMSELEARELRSAKEEERRLSHLSATPTSSLDRTPTSSRKASRTTSRGSPPYCLSSPIEEPQELAHATVQTEETSVDAPAAEEVPPSAQKPRRSWCGRFGGGFMWFVALQMVKMILLEAAPEILPRAVNKMAPWLPDGFESFVSLEASSPLQNTKGTPTKRAIDVIPSAPDVESLARKEARLQEALQQCQTRLTLEEPQKLQQQHPILPVSSNVDEAGDRAASQPHPAMEIQPPAAQGWWVTAALGSTTVFMLAVIRRFV